MLRLFVFVLCLIVLMPLAFDRSATRAHQKGFLPCLTDDQMAKAIISLSSNYDEAQVAQELLREKARESLACRQQVTAAVIKAMDKPNLDISRDQASYYLWTEGAVLLGDLKAVESLDLLLSHIKMSDGSWSSTMTHQPALAGIIRMGPVAIPKLKNLLRNDDWQTRHYAVFCLANIGGFSARRAIETAVAMESHQCVKRLMFVSIKTIDVKHGGLKQDHGEWARAFMCML